MDYLSNNTNSNQELRSNCLWQFAINTYISLFDEKRHLISTRLRLILKIQKYLTKYLLFKYTLIATILLTQFAFGDGFEINSIRLSSVLNAIGGPACHIREKLLCGTTLICLYCMIIIGAYKWQAKEVYLCDLYQLIINRNSYLKEYKSLIN